MSSSAYELFYNRYFGGGFGYDVIYADNFEMGRNLMYEHFYNVYLNNLFFGQGFGVPFWYDQYESAFNSGTTDISFVAFLLPMGSLGLILFILWVSSIYTEMKKSVSMGVFYKIDRIKILNLYKAFFII